MSAKKWDFVPYQELEKERDSSSKKYFREQDINKSLIRELIQNSLDAVDDERRSVSIEIKFKKLEKSQCIQYFESLKPHYTASYDKDMAFGEQIQFLILEDFNTTGLEGEKKHAFLQQDNIRRSNNDRASGGSHGIGKIVFYLVSQISTFFAYSVYANGDVLEGTCDFKTHKINETRYKEDGRLELFFEPDKNFIQALFNRDEKQKGLSVAIPLPDKDLNIKKLKEAIIDEHYYPIINKKFTTELAEMRIDENSILEKKGEKQKLISDYVASPEADVSIKIDIDKAKEKILTKKEKEQITSKLKDGKSVSIRFNFSIKRKKKKPKDGFLDLLIAKKTDGEDKKFDFWRESLLIKEASQKKNRSSEYIVITLINGKDNELSSLLRRLENPSHTRWEYQNLPDDIKNEYPNIARLVPYITQLPNNVINIIKTSSIELNSDFFSRYFTDTSNIGGKPTKDQNLKNIKSKKSNKNSIGVNPNFIFNKNKKNNGFTLSLSAKGKQIKNLIINIKLAYVTNKNKDPFKHYDIRDFNLKKNISIKLTEGKQIFKAENKLSCQVNDGNFKVSLSGFDPNRELKISIEEQK